MEEDFKRISKLIEYIENADYVDASQCFDYEDIQAIENLLKRYKELEVENKKLNNMYRKEYDEHFEMKRQNEVLRNNERILREENEQLKANEEILMKTKGCLNEDNSTNCRVLESLNYGIRAYEKTLKNSIPISVIQNTLKDINKKEKEELKGLKGQDRYFVKQMYQYMRKPLQEILEKGNK